MSLIKEVDDDIASHLRKMIEKEGKDIPLVCAIELYDLRNAEVGTETFKGNYVFGVLPEGYYGQYFYKEYSDHTEWKKTILEISSQLLDEVTVLKVINGTVEIEQDKIHINID